MMAGNTAFFKFQYNNNKRGLFLPQILVAISIISIGERFEGSAYSIIRQYEHSASKIS